MTTTTEEFKIEPLSQHTYPYGIMRVYGQGPGREQQINGDQALLVALTKACESESAFTPLTRRKVAELPEYVVQAIVDEVETLNYGSWKLRGDPSDGILGRLDAHFRPLQEAWRAQCIESEALRAALRRESAEQDRAMAEAQARAVRQMADGAEAAAEQLRKAPAA